MPAMPQWWTESKRLRALGDVRRANEVLVAAGRRGNLEAAATLARYMWAEPDAEQAMEILEEVERRVKPNDWKTHFAVHLAYSMGFGKDVDQHVELQRRAFEHLKAAAKASGDARMHHSVGLHYWEGLNSVPRDIERARQWLQAAASSADAEIVQSYKRFIRKHPCSEQRGAA